MNMCRRGVPVDAETVFMTASHACHLDVNGIVWGPFGEDPGF